MVTFISIKIAYILIYLITVCDSLDAGTDLSSKFYTLSDTELEPIVLDWNARPGLETQHTMPDTTAVQLTPTRPAEK